MEKEFVELIDTMKSLILKLSSEVERQKKEIEQLKGMFYWLPDVQKRKIPYINKEKLDYEIDKANISLNVEEEGNRLHKVIVSMTSFPERMYDIKYTLFSLVSQNYKPDKIILWLAYEEFPNREKDIAPSLMNLINKWGITIKWCNNIRSYKKIIPTLIEYPEDIIVTADDDVFYPVDWLRLLYDDYEKNRCICCHRAHRVNVCESEIMPYSYWTEPVTGEMAYDTFFTGVGGVLYYPHCLHPDVIKQDSFMELCPNADDVWLWAMAIRNHSKIKVVDNNIKSFPCVNPERELRLSEEHTLGMINLGEGKNDVQIHNVVDRYPDIIEILLENIEG